MSLGKSWDLHIEPDVFKVLERVPRRDAEIILQTIYLLPTDPFFGDIQKMKSEIDVWRRRVGSYRIFYKVKAIEKILLVFHLERRASKTY